MSRQREANTGVGGWRTVGELLADSDELAHETLLDATPDHAPAMVRSWNQLVRSAAELGAVLPSGPNSPSELDPANVRRDLRRALKLVPDIRQLRDLTRYRIDLVGVRTAEKNRVDKLLEDACLKLSVVASDIFGVSGRAMMAALIAGGRDPTTLADLARSRMRTKIPRLEESFAGLRLGTFDDHHRFLLARMLARVDAVDLDIAAVDTQIGQHLTPFADAVARLDEIPGIGPTAAAIIIAEIGLDMARFPTPAHLASWAKFAPGINSSAGKTEGNGSTGHGNRYLARVLGEAVAGAGRTDTFLGARYRRIARRRGKNKAIVAVGRSLLVIIWHLLADPDIRFHELGADHYDRHVNTHAKRRNHGQLEALGYRVTLEPAA
jgi:transposase